MVSITTGLMRLIKDKSPEVIGIYCSMHRQALASQVIPEYLLIILKTVIKTVNYIKSSSLRNRLFKKMCEEMRSNFYNLLYYIQI